MQKFKDLYASLQTLEKVQHADEPPRQDMEGSVIWQELEKLRAEMHTQQLWPDNTKWK